MTEATEVWKLTLSLVLVWLQEIFNYRFLAHESIRSWSLMILLSSFQFRILWFDALRPNRGLKEPPWGIPGWSVLSSPLPWSFLWRLWDCPGLWECSVCPLCAQWTGAVLGTQDVPGHCSFLSITLLCHGKVLSGLGCAAVPGCILSKSLSRLCQDAKLFMALMHWAVPRCPWNIQQSNIHPCRKDHSNLFHRITFLLVRSKPGCQKLKGRIKSRDTLFYYIIKKKNLDSPLAGTGGWRLTDRNKIAKNKFYVAIFFLPQMWMLMQNTLL